MTHHVVDQANGNGFTGFYVYRDESYIAGPFWEKRQATHFIETLTEGRYRASYRAGEQVVLRGRRNDGKLVMAKVAD